MSITNKDYQLLRQKVKKIKVRVKILDDLYSVIDDMSGFVKDMSYDISSSSDIRRTCSLTLVLPRNESINDCYEAFFGDRMVELACGIFCKDDNDYIWYPLGRMLMTNSETNYNSTTKEVKVSLVDLLSTLTESRGSQIGTATNIPVGTPIDDAIIGIITTYGKFTRYNVDGYDGDIETPRGGLHSKTLPYDITSDVGDYPYTILKKLMDLYPYYEMYYDSDGVFTVKEIPTKTSDPVDFSYAVLNELLISENRSVDATKIKNTTEIWGKSLNPEYYATSCTGTSTYALTVSGLTALHSGDSFGFTPNVNSSGEQQLSINSIGQGFIWKETGVTGQSNTPVYSKIVAGDIKANVPVVVKDNINSILLTKNTSGDNTYYTPTPSMTAGNIYTITLNLNPSTSDRTIEIYVSQGEQKLCTIDVPPADSGTTSQTVIASFEAKYKDGKSPTDNTIYANISITGESDANINSIQLEEHMFILQGELEIHVIVQEIKTEPNEATKNAYKTENACNNIKWVVNEDSPFASYITNTGSSQFIDGVIKQVLKDGEYANISTTELAYQRASYENYLKDRIQDKISLEMILVPWMDVNDKIEYISPTAGIPIILIVEEIDYDFVRWTMTVKGSKFYDLYPFIQDEGSVRVDANGVLISPTPPTLDGNGLLEFSPFPTLNENGILVIS